MDKIFEMPKGKVNRLDLEAMAAYNKNFNPANYDENYQGDTDPFLVAAFRKYYAEHLPIDAITWLRVNPQTDRLVNVSLYEQVLFAIDSLNPLFYQGEELAKNPPLVVATYRFYNNLTLPVFQFNFKEYTVVAKSYDNVNWYIAVKSSHAIPIDLAEDLFIKGPLDLLHFPQEFQFDAFSANNREHFSCWLSNYSLYCFFFLLSHGMA